MLSGFGFTTVSHYFLIFFKTPTEKGKALFQQPVYNLKKILYLKLLQLYLIFFFLKDWMMNYTFQHNMKYLTHALQFQFNFPNREMRVSTVKAGYIDTDCLVLLTAFPCPDQNSAEASGRLQVVSTALHAVLLITGETWIQQMDSANMNSGLMLWRCTCRFLKFGRKIHKKNEVQ